jgi:hypothetical protein
MSSRQHVAVRSGVGAMDSSVVIIYFSKIDESEAVWGI